MEFLEVPLFDDDFFKLIFRFGVNSVFACLIVGLCYHGFQKSRQYVFTFLLMNVMVFFICFTLKKLDLGLGIALGLFAIFAIIRYRTDAIKVKEMTYLFILIGIAVINSLSNKKTSYTELLFANTMIFMVSYFLERSMFLVQLPTQSVVYDKLELLKPCSRPELFDDIKSRLGLDVQRVKIGKIDLQKGSASIVIHHKLEESKQVESNLS